MNNNILLKGNEYPNGLNPIVKILSYRKLSIILVEHFLIKSPVTPNQITLLGHLLLLSSIILIGTGKSELMIAGAILGPAWIFSDYLDGTLARAKGLSSEFGKKLDAAQDHLANIFIPISATSATFIQYNNKWMLLLGAIIITNVYFFTAGAHNVFKNSQPDYFLGKKKEHLNSVQKMVFEKTGINIGLYSLFQIDTLFFIYWISGIMNSMHYTLWYLLIWSIFRNLLMLKEFHRKYRLVD